MTFIRVALLVLAAAACDGMLSKPEDSCDCTGKLANIQVCGTDDFSYLNICVLKEAQKTDKELGRRCMGPCPCNHTHPEFCKDGSDLSKHYNAADFKDRHTEKIVEMLGIEHSMWGEVHIRRCLFFSVNGNDIVEPAGGFHGPSPNGPVCLIDGGKTQTVENMKVAHCKLSHWENRSVGVRCLGKCEDCAANPGCPKPPPKKA